MPILRRKSTLREAFERRYYSNTNLHNIQGDGNNNVPNIAEKRHFDTSKRLTRATTLGAPANAPVRALANAPANARVATLDERAGGFANTLDAPRVQNSQAPLYGRSRHEDLPVRIVDLPSARFESQAPGNRTHDPSTRGAMNAARYMSAPDLNRAGSDSSTSVRARVDEDDIYQVIPELGDGDVLEDVSRLRISSAGEMDDTGSDNASNGSIHEDVFRLPPTDIISIEEWKQKTSPTAKEPSTEEPSPDYDDDDDEPVEDKKNEPEEEENKEEDYVELRKSVKDRLSTLSYNDWTHILATADKKAPEVDIPDPDYDDTDPESLEPPHSRLHGSPSKDSGSGSGLVVPKKLPNPVLESKERQDLHRELLMNQKMGVDVLHKKSELKKEIERRKDLQKKKEEEEYYRSKRSSFEQKLEEQANKLKQKEIDREKTIKEEQAQPEFLRVHSKIKRTQPQ